MQFSERLKLSTSEVHAQVERQLVKHIKNIESKDNYLSLLELFYGFYAPLNDLCISSALPQNVEYFSHTNHIGLLKNDLTVMGKRKFEIFNENFPEINNFYQALGALYVMKGSMLGGQVISSIIRKRVEGIEDTFFTSGGQDVKSNWLQFKIAIDNITDPQHQEDVIESAKSTFDCFGKWIKKYHAN
jgi:heme oxygenase (biliverdin-IX-beta and delta-forming)